MITIRVIEHKGEWYYAGYINEVLWVELSESRRINFIRTKGSSACVVKVLRAVLARIDSDALQQEFINSGI